MTGRRESVLAASLDVLADHGGHGLTHRAVDRRAGVPEGTTSNYFRSREALLAAALEQLSAGESAAMAALGADGDALRTRSGLALVVAGMIEFLLGPGRTLAVARHALFLEATVRPSLRPALVEASGRWWALVAGVLSTLGCDRPDLRARLLLAFVDGVLADQLARPQADFDARAAVDLAFAGLVPA